MNSIGNPKPEPLIGGVTEEAEEDHNEESDKTISVTIRCQKSSLIGRVKALVLVTCLVLMVRAFLWWWADDEETYESYMKKHHNNAGDSDLDANDCELTPDDFLDWDELSPEKQRVYKSRYYTKEIWDDPKRSPCDPPLFFGRSQDFHPLVVSMPIPAVQAVNMSVLDKMDVPVRLFDFYHHDAKDPTIVTYQGVEEMPMKTYMKDYVCSGNTTYYLLMEDRMHEKKNIQHVVGTNIVQHMERAIETNEELAEGGQWNPVWSGLPPENYRWAMFLGATGTRTEMHLDTDVFNFFYVVQGRKRVIIVPNDERNQEEFGQVHWSTTGGEGQLDYRLLDTTPLPDLALEIELGPGQGLAIPYLAWHAVENLEPTLAYSVRVLDGRRRSRA